MPGAMIQNEGRSNIGLGKDLPSCFQSHQETCFCVGLAVYCGCAQASPSIPHPKKPKQQELREEGLLLFLATRPLTPDECQMI